MVGREVAGSTGGTKTDETSETSTGLADVGDEPPAAGEEGDEMRAIGSREAVAGKAPVNFRACES